MATPAQGGIDKFDALAILVATSTAYDMETTAQALASCPDCSEANPFVRPFRHGNTNRMRAQMHAIGALSSYGVIYASRHLKNKGWGFDWWGSLMIGIATAHIVAGIHNQSH